MRLIDADALKKAIPSTHVDIFENCRNCELLDDEKVKQIIDGAPTIERLKEQDETINDLTDTIRQLNQHIKDLSEYMTPYGKVKDVKAYAELLKEQEELLRKLQNDKDKLCLEVSKWKHKFHDAPPKFVSQGVVDQIRWERDTALSQLEQIGKGLGSKMDDIVALLKEQEAELSYREAKAITHTATKLDDATCPSCGNVVGEKQRWGERKILIQWKYCIFCGQKLDWEGR